MISPVLTIADMDMKNQNRKKIGVGSIVKSNVGELENITRYGSRRSMRKVVVECIQDVTGEK